MTINGVNVNDKFGFHIKKSKDYMPGARPLPTGSNLPLFGQQSLAC